MRTIITVSIALMGLTCLCQSFQSAYAGDRWEEVELKGGIANEFAVGPGGMVYAFTKHRSLFRSSDHGRSWARATTPWGSGPWSGEPNPGSTTLAVNPSGHVFVGFGPGAGPSALAKSTDRGNSWTICIDSLWPSCLLTTPDGVIYAGQGNREDSTCIWRSSDGGETWTGLRQGLSNLLVYCLAQSPSGTLFAGGEGEDSHVYESTDGGDSWKSAGLSAGSSVVQLLCSDRGHVFAVGVGAEGDRAVFRSSKRAVWERADSGLPPLGFYGKIAEIEDGELIAATDSGLFCSTNRGESWVGTGDCLEGRTIYGLATNTLGEILAGVSPEGVLLSIDVGDNWLPSNNGFWDVRPWDIATTPNGHIWVGGEVAFEGWWGGSWRESFLYRSTNEGLSWSVGHRFSGDWRLWASPTGSLFSTTWWSTDISWGNELWRSDTSGNNWSLVLSYHGPPAFGPDGSIFIVKVWIEDTLMFSSDNGETWHPVLENPVLVKYDWDNLAVNQLGMIFVLGDGNLQRSTDRGTSWEEVCQFSQWGGYASSIHASRSGDLFVDGTSVRRSTDLGVTWTVLLDSDGEDSFSAFASSENGDVCWGLWGDVYNEVGGVFYLPAGGTTPLTFSQGLPSGAVTALAYFDDNEVYAGAPLPYAGMYRRVHVPSAITGEAQVPRNLALGQNYPNPFNPATTIQFSIVNTQFTILKVYDLLGREVAVLVNEKKAPGTYTVQFDGSGLTSGVYLYRLQAGTFVQTRKLLLLR